MARYLVYIDIEDLSLLDKAFEGLVDDHSISEYFTLTENGEPILYDNSMVGCPEFCNGMAIRAAGITEE